MYVGDDANPYNVFDFTLNRSREGPKEFLKGYTQVMLADAYRGYNGVVGLVTPSLARDVGRMRGAQVRGGGEIGAGDRARGGCFDGRTVFCGKTGERRCRGRAIFQLRQKQSVPILAELHHKLLIWKERLLPKHPTMADAVNYTLGQWETLTVFTTDGAVPVDNNA